MVSTAGLRLRREPYILKLLQEILFELLARLLDLLYWLCWGCVDTRRESGMPLKEKAAYVLSSSSYRIALTAYVFARFVLIKR
jgi:hypothetical protein